MATLPASGVLGGSSITTSNFKTEIENLRDVVAEDIDMSISKVFQASQGMLEGITGGYNETGGSGTGSNWAAPVWSIGANYTGDNDAGSTWGKTSFYGMAWVRGSHSEHRSDVGEGLYLYQAGSFRAGIGTAGIETTGSLKVAGSVQGTSDRRVKTNFRKIENALDKVAELCGFLFDRTDIELTQYSLIAQDVEKVLPEAISYNEHGIRSIDLAAPIALLVNAVNEITERLDQMEVD